jgi:hypothetical protein
MSQMRELTAEERLALAHEVARRGVGPIAPVALRILHLWDAYWTTEAPDPAARPISPEGPRDPEVAYDHKRKPRNKVSLDTTVAARTEDGAEVMLIDRLTAHGVVTAKSAASVLPQAEAATVDRERVVEWTMAYHRALATIEPWARDLLNMVAAGRTQAEIAAATGRPPKTVSNQVRKAQKRLADAVIPTPSK